MCGISGIYHYGKNVAVDREALIKSAGVLSHRGPDEEGFFVDTRVGLAHRRLSIIDLEGGHQPLTNEDGSIHVIYNGEIYNFLELGESLKGKGHQFRTKSDGEVIAHLYEEYGTSFVKRLNGMFAFALWDDRKKKLLLGRDRVGIKPLYYHDDGASLRFASEIKALLVDPLVERKVDIRALDYYLTFLHIPAPYTIFKGIKKLPPAHILNCEKNGVSIEKYWDINLSDTEEEGSEEYFIELLEQYLQKAVKSQLVSDVPLGAFLSGGVDSSGIVAFMSRILQVPVKTFSIGFQSDASYNELEYARSVAQHCGTDHHEFILKPNIRELLTQIVWHLDEPFADGAVIPFYCLSRVARDYVKVVLTGDGADELFGGYPRYYWDRLGGLYQFAPQAFRNSLILPIVNGSISTLPHANMAFMRKLKKFVNFSELPPVERHAVYISFFRAEDKDLLYSGEFNHLAKNFDTHDILQEHFQMAQPLGFYNQRLYVDVKTTLPDQMLTKADRMSMMASLEARVPFLDNNMLELTFAIPSHLKIKYGETKYILKKCFSNLLPENILRRRKHGLDVPLDEWFRDELKEWLLDCLSESQVRKRGYFDPRYITNLVNAHLAGKENFGRHLWILLILELWHRVFMDGEVSGSQGTRELDDAIILLER
ncbi:MAG: asparagine synthase (glutamine-hydrolyzing) [bacterium]